MSWPSSSYPPPPRRSRSRSPGRGSYSSGPPFPESGYPRDPYRAEWEAYDRDRFANYERERSGYDYGRRGRSRSPPPDDFSRKRRRSQSPYERDRYEPRPRYSDDYDAHSRGHGPPGSPPRRAYPGPYAPSRRPPPDPHTFDYPASLKQYAEWFRFYYPQQAIEEDNADKAAEHEAGDGSKPRNGIKSRWEKYKKDFAATQLQTMFEHHRKSPWFAEKYDPAPEFQALRTRVRKEGWRGRIDSFLLDLETGKFDPESQETEPEPSSPLKDAPTNGEHPNGDANGAMAPAISEETKPHGGDDDMQFNMDAEDDAGGPEANGRATQDNRRTAARGDEIAVPLEGNSVTIRTIPPDIGRVKLEEALCKVPGFLYLALGDPMQKRNYYRAGWIRFHDDADMSAVMTDLSEKKIEGFKLHVTHNTRPFMNRIRYTPDVASRPERLEKDLAKIKVLAGLLEDEAATLRKARVAKVTSPVKLEVIPGEGDIKMEDPIEHEEEDPEPKEKGSDAVERRVEKIMADLREQGLVDPDDEKAYEAKRTVVALDLYIAYLRATYHTCYYCALVTDHLEELQRKCVKHERKSLPKTAPEDSKAVDTEKAHDGEEKDAVDREQVKEKERPKTDTRDGRRNDDRWLEWLDSKLALLINRDGVNAHDYGGKNIEDELSKAVEPFIKQEDEGKFRCKTCQKLFKATSFVEKHIANKHPEVIKSMDDIPYYNNFALDPHRIQPFMYPPPVVGGGQPPPPQAYGIQAPAYPGEYGRPHYAQSPFPPMTNGFWPSDPYAGGFAAPPLYPPMGIPPRRDEATTARRLSDRISGFAPETSTLPVGVGLPPKPVAALDSALQAGNGNNRRANRNSILATGPPPPPPPDAKEDPRAAAGKRVSYHDMDLVAEGDVELTY
ncbi:hypothetical protein HGRIS_009821 [Hohenbuehelia grisea]|uniref:C2H2-type domain-containing protein n=1 Tax=Hohenbuehelia grisea TaxID=104357 RepID=A0ABR3J2I4_9AGAR